MSNPPFLVCDADATIQLLAAGFHEQLRALRTRYGIQPVVVDVVATELRNFKKISTIPAHFEKSIAKKVICELTLDVFRQHFAANGGPLNRGEHVDRLWAAVQSLGSRYELVIDRGEAYSFAMAVELGLPVMTNDFRSIQTMRGLGNRLPEHLLRSFDLLALAVQNGTLAQREMGKMCGRLRGKKEWVPSILANQPFEDAIAAFDVRVVDTGAAPLGTPPHGALRLAPVDGQAVSPAPARGHDLGPRPSLGATETSASPLTHTTLHTTEANQVGLPGTPQKR